MGKQLGDRVVAITAKQQNREERIKRIEGSFRDLQNNTTHANIRVIGVPEEEEKNKGTENIFEEITVANSPSMGKEIISQVQEAQSVPYRTNPQRNTLRHILINLTEIKHEERMLKVVRENQDETYNGKLIE